MPTAKDEGNAADGRFSTAWSDAAVVVRYPFDIVLSKIFPRLDLDEGHLILARVPEAMGRPAGDINGAPRPQGDLPVFNGRDRLSTDEVPVLSPAAVALETQALSRKNADPLDLVIRLIA
jgi:hypothetical protein